jgi:glucosamine--fructose-6-phosphate aminotransferase (isomerizing)
MCGIFGIIYNKNKNKDNLNLYNIIIEGLIQLQNRGYDSSGICLLNNNNFNIYKCASTSEMSAIEKLKKIDINLENSTIGIGHNRWATHGGKTDYNAHPHHSNDLNFCLVHNGIIENYQKLKAFLINKNFTFYSETDTEIIVNLVSYYYNINNNTLEAIKNTINDLEGTYALIIINKNEDDKLYVVRNGSPLLVGIQNNMAIITSEQSGFCNKINKYITLENKDVCILEKNLDKIYLNTKTIYIENDVNILKNDLSPFPFKHWTIKEIMEQPTTILNSLNHGGRIKNNSEVKLGGVEEYLDELKTVENIIFLGCGTSFHVGLFGRYFFNKICDFNTVQVFDGADFVLTDIPRKGKTALVLISQSGETRDLYLVLEKIKDKKDIITIGIINVVDSLIAREVNCGIYCNAGREMGVASTKSFTSQVICISLLAIWFSQIKNINEEERIKIIKDLNSLSGNFYEAIFNLKENIEKVVEKFKKYNNLFILGKDLDECIAREGSLKIKEISYIHSESYSASSLKHGPFALLDKEFPVVILNCNKNYSSKILNCFEEVHSRNSPIILITNEDVKLNKDCEIIKIPKNDTFGSLVGIIPLQLLSYYFSISKNINPDIPKNLAKVVTVE